MTKHQRVMAEVRLAISRNALGAGRTAAIAKILKKYRLSDGELRGMCLFNGGGGRTNYWV